MEFAEVVDARRSVRDFSDTPVNIEDVRAVVKQAGRSASWCNAQPWRVYAATGEVLERLREAWAERLGSGDEGGMEIEGVHREGMTERAAANMEGFFGLVGPYLEAGTLSPKILYGAPCVLILTVPRGASQYAMYDLGAFGEQLMLSAADRGIDSLTAAMFVLYPDVLRRELSIPDNEAIAIGIGLGYASDASTNGIVTPRMALDECLVLSE